MSGDICDCCQRGNVVGVASSALGAISFAWCSECLQQNAEPEWMLEFTFQSCEGNPNDWVRSFSTYVDGKYVPWDEWVKDKVVDPHYFDPKEEEMKENGN